MRSFIIIFLTLLPTLLQAQPIECRIGLQAMEQKRFMESIQPLTNCLQLQLNVEPRAFILGVRAHAYGELKQWGAAAEDQKQSILLVTPKDVWSHVMLGAYLREQKKFDEALEALQSAMKFDEDGPGTGPGMAVHYHTAQTLHQAGRYKEAIEVITLGIPKQPDYGYALYQRALSYEALGDRVQAKRDLFRVVELMPKDGYEPEIAKKLSDYGFKVKVRN